MNTERLRRVPIEVAHEFPGSEIGGDVLEFLKAIEAYKRRYRRRFPAWSEVLFVLRQLGYAKVHATPPEIVSTPAELELGSRNPELGAFP